MGTVRVILSCSAIFSLTIMDGFGAPLGSWRKERKGKSRVARRRANKKNHFRLHSSFPPSFGWRWRGVLLLPPPALALARSPSLPPSAAHPPPPRRGRRSRHRAPSSSARRPICPNNDSDSDPIMCGERKGETDRQGKRSFPLLPCRILAFHALGISVSLPGRIVTLKKGNEEPQYQKIEREKWRGEYLGFPARASCPRCPCCAAPRPTHLVTNHAPFRQRGVGTCRKLLTFRVHGRGSAKSKSTFTGIHSRI